jgi:predicted ATPase
MSSDQRDVLPRVRAPVRIEVARPTIDLLALGSSSGGGDVARGSHRRTHRSTVARVRIAFSGSHRVGKSTLVASVAEALPRHATVDEPYHLLEEEGYECSETPSVEDLEAQLERSLAALEEGEPNVLFDRSPVDLFAYLLAHEDADAFDADGWSERTREAIRSLDLVVFVPIEERDRIALPSHEDRHYRLEVHERLHELLVDDALGFEADVLIVHGDVQARVDQVIARIGVRRPA